MIIFKSVSDLQQHLHKLKAQHKTIGFVPTMGALHQGHLSLVQQSQQHCNVSVVSIFVNPTQFNDPRDFEKYPVTIDKDCLLLEEQKADILFLPSVKEMYPGGLSSNKHYALGELENLLEGRYRPGHFQGVCQVVERLLRIVEPHQLFLGQKDYQQCMVLQKLIQLENLPVELNVSPTLREIDGLAMSSRNMRLTDEQRQKATAIFSELKRIEERLPYEAVEQLQQTAANNLVAAGFSKIDYVSVADAEILHPLTDADKDRKAVALVAAFIGEVRLIDNLLLN